MLFCAVGSASPTYYGPSGLANVPGPGAMRMGDYNLFYNLISADRSLSFFGGNIGLGIATPIEVGATIVKPERGSSNTLLNAKVAFTTGKERPIDVAVGVIDVTDERDRVIYLVGGKVLNANSAGKGGIPAIYGMAGLGSSNSVLDGLFFGVSANLPEGLNAHVEYDAEDVNLGVNYPIGEGLNLRADLVSNDFGFGVCYTLPKK